MFLKIISLKRDKKKGEFYELKKIEILQKLK